MWVGQNIHLIMFILGVIILFHPTKDLVDSNHQIFWGFRFIIISFFVMIINNWKLDNYILVFVLIPPTILFITIEHRAYNLFLTLNYDYDEE